MIYFSYLFFPLILSPHQSPPPFKFYSQPTSLYTCKCYLISPSLLAFQLFWVDLLNFLLQLSFCKSNFCYNLVIKCVFLYWARVVWGLTFWYWKFLKYRMTSLQFAFWLDSKRLFLHFCAITWHWNEHRSRKVVSIDHSTWTSVLSKAHTKA